jgi:hypothetical protein
VPPRRRLLLNVKINATMLHDSPLLSAKHSTGARAARPMVKRYYFQTETLPDEGRPDDVRADRHWGPRKLARDQ